MQKRYLVLWLLYGALLGAMIAGSLLMAVHDMAIALLFLTCGLGFPLIYIATPTAYLACLAPAVALAPFRLARWPGLLASVGLWAALAMVPPRLSAASAEAERARLTADDHAPSAPASARSLEFVWPEDGTSLTGAYRGAEPCDERCQALLLGGEVDWVRVVGVKNAFGRDPEPPSRVRMVRATGDACATPDAPAKPDDACLVYREDLDEPADLTLTVEEDRGRDPLLSAATWLLRPIGHRRLTVTRPGPSGPERLAQATELQVEALIAPTLFGPELTGMSSQGVGPLRSHQRLGPLDLDATLRALGFKMAALDALRAAPAKAPKWSDPPSADQTRQVLSILDLPGDSAFTDDQQAALAKWVASARTWRQGDGWTPERLAILRRIVRETRAGNVWSIDQLFRDSDVVVTTLLGDVIELTEAHGFTERRPWTGAWYGLDEAAPAALIPYADRILALIDAHPEEAGRLLPLAGRLGVDPSPYLLPLSVDVDRELLSARARGACRAEPRWAPALLSRLRDLTAAMDLDRSQDRDVAELAARALLRHGDAVWVEGNLPGRGKEGERLWRNLKGRLRALPDPEALCR